VPTTPPSDKHPWRIRSGLRRRPSPGGRATSGSQGESAVRNGGTNGGGTNGNGNGASGTLSPAARRSARRDALMGRRPRHRAKPRRRPLLRLSLLALGILCTMAVAGVATLFAGYNVYAAEIPDAATVASMEPSLDSNVYSSDGTLIDIIHTSGSFHLHADLSGISKYAIEATIDIEDRHFYQEQSIDVPRLVQAGLGYLSHSSTSGASTITEQLAKISFLQDNGSISYKIKEIMLGSEIASDFTKPQILDMYLNRIPYGNQTYGIGTAAEVYFHVPASKLDLAQAAMLAGLPQSPTNLDPLSNQNSAGINPFAKQRQDAVLQAMVSNNDIT
jgi:penicillin-binding protein 1A